MKMTIIIIIIASLSFDRYLNEHEQQPRPLSSWMRLMHLFANDRLVEEMM